MRNRFYTILVIPEKTSQIRKFLIPSWIVKGSLIGLCFAVVLAGIMVLDYWFVMNQISENKDLKFENRRLRQQVQIFENKVESVEESMDRIQSFATRLRVITNIEDRDGFVQRLNQNLPDASTNVTFRAPKEAGTALGDADPSETENSTESSGDAEGEIEPEISEFELARLQQEQEELGYRLTQVNFDTLVIEQNLQDLYELLIDQKIFLLALPTRKPSLGYFTSGFGVRKSPYGGRIKMHEGLDIANRPGTAIKSTAYGTVIFSGVKPGYGKTIIIDHGYGLETWYSHARKNIVKKGVKVKRGQKVALMGSTGQSTGSHVHYEVRVNGIPVDPLTYILEN